MATFQRPRAQKCKKKLGASPACPFESESPDLHTLYYRSMPTTPGPKGPILPRKDTGEKHLREVLSSAAYQAGVLLAMQRHRHGLRQEELGKKAGLSQTEISRIENGQPTKAAAAAIDTVFQEVGFKPSSEAAEFVKWWTALHA